MSGKRGRPSRNLLGRRYGRLMVTHKTPRRTSGGHVVWRCLCDCGKVTEVPSRDLTKGATTSCGCWRKERMGNLRAATVQTQPPGVLEQPQTPPAQEAKSSNPAASPAAGAVDPIEGAALEGF